MSFRWDFSTVSQYADVLAFGLLFNFALSFVSITIGSIFGAGLFFARVSSVRFLRWIAQAYIEIFLALPVLVLLVWLYFCLPVIGLPLGPFAAAATALALSFACFAAELFRGGAASLSTSEIDAARAFGLSKIDIFRFVVLPAFAKVTLPPFITLCIDTLKYSTLAAYVTVPESLYASNLIIAKTFRPLEVYTALGLLFLVTIVPMVLFARWIGKDQKYGRMS